MTKWGCTFSSCSQNRSLCSSSSLDCYLEYSLGCKSSHIIRWEHYTRNCRTARRCLDLWMTKSWIQLHYSKTALGGGWLKRHHCWLTLELTPGNQRHLCLPVIFGMWVPLAFMLPAAAPRTLPWDNDVVLKLFRQYKIV